MQKGEQVCKYCKNTKLKIWQATLKGHVFLFSEKLSNVSRQPMVSLKYH